MDAASSSSGDWTGGDGDHPLDGGSRTISAPDGPVRRVAGDRRRTLADVRPRHAAITIPFIIEMLVAMLSTKPRLFLGTS
jgi:hypothetical protein